HHQKQTKQIYCKNKRKTIENVAFLVLAFLNQKELEEILRPCKERKMKIDWLAFRHRQSPSSIPR
ncbi:hypothetical protein, partial [Lactococcus cremoris]|uniref:hypothetical protein n=1 Tax=Lactococcus lactis subsp. cremoris TaxID=1359 RepID=UPI0038545FE7